MKKVAIEEAVGLTLCHDLTEIRDGFKGVAFRRNHVIEQGDLEHLRRIGKLHVFVWDPSGGELHEEDCARRMAQALCTDGFHYEGPAEGKCVLVADRDGFLCIDLQLLGRLNRIPDVTVCSLPNHYRVRRNQRIASMRIVPLVTAAANIEKFEQLCARSSLFEFLPFKKLRVGIVITGSEIYHHRIEDRFEPVLRRKLAAFPSEIIGVSICDDSLSMIEEAAAGFIDAGAQLLIFTGGMSVDPDDLTPAAIRNLGADIVSYGVPSQPGNMSLLAYSGNIAMLGVPGAAVSRPVTTLDVFLPQIFTGRKFTPEDLAGLAEGGLCQLCANCHFPNCTFGRY